MSYNVTYSHLTLAFNAPRYYTKAQSGVCDPLKKFSGRVRAGSTGFVSGPVGSGPGPPVSFSGPVRVRDWVWTQKMVKKAPKNGEKGPKSDKKFSGRVRAGSNLLFSGPGRVRATAKSPGPVRAGVDHRPLVLEAKSRVFQKLPFSTFFNLKKERKLVSGQKLQKKIPKQL